MNWVNWIDARCVQNGGMMGCVFANRSQSSAKQTNFGGLPAILSNSVQKFVRTIAVTALALLSWIACLMPAHASPYLWKGGAGTAANPFVYASSARELCETMFTTNKYFNGGAGWVIHKIKYSGYSSISATCDIKKLNYHPTAPWWRYGAIGGFRIDECPNSTDTASWDGEKLVCAALNPDKNPQRCPTTPNPISIGWGDKNLNETDLISDELVESLVRRHYNSARRTASLRLGRGWAFGFERRLVADEPDRVLARRPNGRAVSFQLINGVYQAEIDSNYVLERRLDDSWLLVTGAGRVEKYDASGRLIQLQSPAGQAVQLNYDSNGLLTTIESDRDQRWSFGYDEFYRVSVVETPEGETLTYGYDDQSANCPDASCNLLTSVEYTDGSSRTFVYNEPGLAHLSAMNQLLTGIVDESLVRFATYTYDEAGRAITSTHADDLDAYQVGYGSAHSVVKDPSGTTREYAFETIHGVLKLTGQSQPAGAGCNASTSALTYDANGNVATRTDFDGAVTTYTYDLTRNLETSRIEASGTADARTVTTDWHPDWHLRTRLAEPKLITTWVYNGQPDPVNGGTASCAPTDAEVIPGLPIAVVCSKVEQPTTDANGAQGFSATVDGDARIWTYTYNRYGKVLTADGPRSDVADVWTYEYYAADATCPGAGEGTGMDKGCRGELMRATDPVGLITEYVKYNAHGQVLQMRTPNGVLSTYTYDLRQRLTSQSVGALLTTFDYDPRGLLDRVTLPDGSAIAYTYDAAHRLTDITQAATGERIHYTLDNAGNHTAETVYDAQGAVARSLTRQFDALGRLWKEIRSLNGQSAETVFLHDEEDRLTRTTDPLTHANQWQYNKLGQLKAQINALNQNTAITPDAQGNTTQVQAANGATTQYTVNGLGEVMQEVSPDRGTTTYGYNAAGDLRFRSRNNADEMIVIRDALGRPTATYYLGSSSFQVITTTWDTAPNGAAQIASLAGPDATLSFGYDSLGRISSQSQSLDGIDLTLAYGYDAGGRLQTLTYPSGRILSIGYDSAGRIDDLALSPYQIASAIQYHPFAGIGQLTLLNGLVHQRGEDINGLPQGYTVGGVPLDFGFDLAGRITSLDQTGTAYDQIFGYDAADRLTDYNGFPGTRAYTYDANGNRTSETIAGILTSLTYQANSNRLVQIGTQSQSLDAAGNLIAAAGTSFTYGADGRMRTTTTGAGTVSYRYDALGRRVEKTGPTSLVPNGAVRYMYDDAHHLIGEYQQDGTPIREYVWLGDLPVAVLDSNPDGTTSAYAIETDHLGTPRLLTDATQTPRWRWTSPPFGEVLPDENPSGLGAVTFNLRFPGQYYDKESGLSYNWHRVYDAETGRYVQSDPIGLNGGWNTYGYVGGNPLSWIDSTGLAQCTFTMSTGRLICAPTNPANNAVNIQVASGNNGGGMQCRNNPACTAIPNRGPIPLGCWQWTNGFTGKPNGRVLVPCPGTNTNAVENRTLIRSHSCAYPFGPSLGPQFCSEGCVTGTVSAIQNLNQLIDAEPGSQLQVVP